MATYSSILAWKIPWTEERGELHSIGLQRISTHTQITEYNGTSYNVWCDLHFIEWKTEVWGKLSPKPHS